MTLSKKQEKQIISLLENFKEIEKLVDDLYWEEPRMSKSGVHTLIELDELLDKIKKS
tara:strand:+ start:120 stop:290 length:171 start_codon:yes stop_codon:yes gene_type:complete